jgi:hypothetical protein
MRAIQTVLDALPLDELRTVQSYLESKSTRLRVASPVKTDLDGKPDYSKKVI